jgi:hypothetical protein
MTVLCLVETDAGGAADASLRALVVARELARSAGEELAAAWFGPSAGVAAADLAAAGVSSAWAIGSAELPGYAPLAWARALAGLSSGDAGPVSAVVAAATDHGNEVLAPTWPRSATCRWRRTVSRHPSLPAQFALATALGGEPARGRRAQRRMAVPYCGRGRHCGGAGSE